MKIQKVGISLIFHVQNGVEYMKEKQLGFLSQEQTSVTFSGLALDGKILFPIKKKRSAGQAGTKKIP